jgi:hypothetical protein
MLLHRRHDNRDQHFSASFEDPHDVLSHDGWIEDATMTRVRFGGPGSSSSPGPGPSSTAIAEELGCSEQTAMA